MLFILTTLAWAETGEALYIEHCASCHGSQGRATFPGKMMGAGSLAKAKFWTDRPEERLRDTVARGGKAMGLKSAMPAFEDQFTPEEIDSVLAFALSFRPSEIHQRANKH